MIFYQPNLGKPPSIKAIDLNKIDLRNGILIRSTNWLGDAIMTLPALFKIKNFIKDRGKIFVITTEKLTSFWESVSWIDAVVSFYGKRIDKDCLPSISQLDPGMCIVLPNSFGSAFDLHRAGIPNIVGRAGRARSLFLDYSLPAWKRKPGKDIHHETRKYLEFSCLIGNKDWDCHYQPISPNLSTSEFRNAKVKILANKPLLVIAPGAAYGPAKQWPEQYFKEIAKWWANTHGNIIAIGSKTEFQLAQYIVKDIPLATNLAGGTTLAQLMYILSLASCIVANDSGPMHLGAALGKKGVGLFGSTDPVATGPIGGKWIVFYKEVNCSPCLNRTCKLDKDKYKCLRTITPDEVISAIEELIQ